MNSQSPELLAIQTCMKTQNKEVSRWMSHHNHRITFRDHSLFHFLYQDVRFAHSPNKTIKANNKFQ